jgi:putative flippase GtrA
VNVKEIIKSNNSLIQFIKFGVVGLSNTLLGLGIYYLLLFLGANYLICNFLSWVISVFNAFYWNNKYVFKNENTWIKALLKTYASYGFTFIVSTGLLFILVEWCRVSEVLAPVLCLLVTIPLNFLLNKFWTFK